MSITPVVLMAVNVISNNVQTTAVAAILINIKSCLLIGFRDFEVTNHFWS